MNLKESERLFRYGYWCYLSEKGRTDPVGVFNETVDKLNIRCYPIHEPRPLSLIIFGNYTI